MLRAEFPNASFPQTALTAADGIDSTIRNTVCRVIGRGIHSGTVMSGAKTTAVSTISDNLAVAMAKTFRTKNKVQCDPQAW